MPNGPQFYHVVGTVVGYLHQSDEEKQDHFEHDVMIVKVEAFAGRKPDADAVGVPVFVLRWLGHDWFLANDDSVIDQQKRDYGLLIGCRISFYTSNEEQEAYASEAAAFRN